jgi:hypothetical protein
MMLLNGRGQRRSKASKSSLGNHADGAAGARFVSNRSADAGTGAEHAPERRSPTRRVSVRGPNARLFEAVRAFHEPPLFRPPQAGARFVPNRSADAGTGAEPTQRRGLAERCELGQLALRRQGRFMAGEQVRKEQGTFHEPPLFGRRGLERGLSQTAARMLARALNLPRGVAWRSAASWDNSRSGAKAGSWPVSRSERNKQLPMSRLSSGRRRLERGLSQTAARMLARALNMHRSAGLRSGALVSGRRIEPGRRPALQSRGSWR